ELELPRILAQVQRHRGRLLDQSLDEGELAQPIIKRLKRAQGGTLQRTRLLGEGDDGFTVGRGQRGEVQGLDFKRRGCDKLGNALFVALFQADGLLARQGKRSASFAGKKVFVLIASASSCTCGHRTVSRPAQVPAY